VRFRQTPLLRRRLGRVVGERESRPGGCLSMLLLRRPFDFVVAEALVGITILLA
jgi:hypothetical protein